MPCGNCWHAGRNAETGKKLKCLELLFIRGRANKDTAVRLGLTEQQVANYKSDFIIQLRRTLKKQGLPAEIFPELYED